MIQARDVPDKTGGPFYEPRLQNKNENVNIESRVTYGRY